MKRVMPKATAARLSAIEGCMGAVEDRLKSGDIAAEDAEMMVAHLEKALVTLVLEDAKRSVGRPRSAPKGRSNKPLGMLAQYMPKKAEMRGRPRKVNPPGLEGDVYRVVAEIMARDGVGVTTAIEMQIGGILREFSLGTWRSKAWPSRARNLYYLGKKVSGVR